VCVLRDVATTMDTMEGGAIDLGSAPSASQMPGRRLIEELEKRGLKASGFPDDDARRLQVLLDAEWEATKVERMKEARAAALKKMELDAALSRRKHAEAQLREEEATAASDETAALLLRCVAEDATPPSLELRALAPAAVRALVKALSSNTSLKSLDLVGCNLTDDAVAGALGDMLARNKGLHSLALDFNALTGATAGELARGLASNATLRALSLEGNALGGGEGVAALADAVAAHAALQSLNVFDTRLGTEGGHAVARAVIANARLLSVQVSPFDGVEDADLAAVAAAVERNRGAAEAARRDALAAAGAELVARATAAASAGAKEAVDGEAEWSAADMERRAKVRQDAEFARAKREALERHTREQEYKEYVFQKEEKERAAKAKAPGGK
jgi:hypothetical protein